MYTSTCFWKSYEKIKDYSPRYKSDKQEQSIEKKAINSLKSLIRQNEITLEQDIILFINTLLKDLKKYKTLSKYTIRKLVLPENKNNAYEILINNIKTLKRRLGNDYLDIITKKAADLDEDIIIAVENKLRPLKKSFVPPRS